MHGGVSCDSALGAENGILFVHNSKIWLSTHAAGEIARILGSHGALLHDELLMLLVGNVSIRASTSNARALFRISIGVTGIYSADGQRVRHVVAISNGGHWLPSVLICVHLILF